MHEAAATAAASHVAQWQRGEPDLHLAGLFVAPLRDASVRLIEALAFELHDALFGVHDARVAQAKLAWWLDELAQPARHPLHRELARLCPDGAVTAGLREAAAALLHLAHQDSIETLAQLLGPLQQAAVGTARARAGAGSDVGAEVLAGNALAASRVVTALRDWPTFARAERAWLPLDLLARHSLSRAAAERAGEAAAALVASLCAELRQALAPIAARDLRGVDGARIAAARAWCGHMQAGPGAVVDGRLAPPRIALVLSLWRVGRRG
jgi:phytoene synthase